jgi:hypothetical protein
MNNMRRDFVIDACSFKLFYDELVANTFGVSRRSLEHILENDVIIVDFLGHIRHEWMTTCCGEQDEFIRQWIINRIVEDRIQERTLKKDKAVRNSIRELGIPQRDHKYIYLAVFNHAFAIISEDIDFYDPREKNRGEARVARMKHRRDGCVCRYLRQAHKIEIFPLEMTLGCV